MVLTTTIKDIVNLTKQRVAGIGLENFFIAFGKGNQQARVLQSLEIKPDSVG